MYKHGKPVYKLSRRPLVVSAILVLLALAAGYYFLILPNTHSSISGSNTALVTSIKDNTPNSTPIEGDVFTALLPGPWKLAAKDFDARYHSYQWTSSDKKNNGRLFRVYVDTIPKDQAVNYLVPVKIENNAMGFGTVSENCVGFTQGAKTLDNRPANIPSSQAALPSRWGQVDFLCDNANVEHQVVGAASSEALNTISLSGPTKGKHKFFFLYQNNDISPDLGQFETILGSFQVK